MPIYEAKANHYNSSSEQYILLPSNPLVFLEENMATIETNTKSSLHTRCNSLPSAAHPFVSQFEEHLQRLKGSEATSSFSSSSVSQKISGIQDLHDCIDKLLQLPIKQQTLALECNEKWFDNLLEGSLRLLDICSITRDCLLQSKESMHKLQSVIRRRRGDVTGFTVDGEIYLASRKKMKKEIQNALKNLKGIKHELIASSSNKDNNTSPMLSFLKEAEAITLNSLEHLFLFISDPKGHSKQSRWSVISKLMQTKRATCDSQDSNTNEFEKVDAALQSLISRQSSSIENFQTHMENLEMCIQDLETGIEQLSRKLIRNRVFLLNIFNH
ncbi:uncharacterized protein LOC133298035 [Gastrolobium bilobum]|uniref:uncharacterized protein LOC133298035 n=1 Tax=Gastrolobium bilobum TaxID=150636 RepID=UPI002AB15A0D|nr:uncharacterized protein LOC133298035 [Gastrolobium bilobum]